jgi:SAM-dependent methyltransferase
VAYESYYEEVAPQFDALRLDREQELAVTCDLVARRHPPPARLLDVGCGTGRYGARLRDAGFHVTGVDISRAQLQYAQGLDVAVCGSADDLPFEPGTFDVCLIALMIHQLSVPTRAKAIAECARVLTPGGLLCIKTCSHADLAARPLATYFPSALAINVARYPDIALLRADLRSGGFRAIAVEATYTEDRVPAATLLGSVNGKHNTTLALLPSAEYESGVEHLKRDLMDCDDIVISHRHTHVVGVRAQSL